MTAKEIKQSVWRVLSTNLSRHPFAVVNESDDAIAWCKEYESARTIADVLNNSTVNENP